MNQITSEMHPGTDIQVLREAMLFSLTRHTWSNRRSADKSALTTTADKSKFNLTKQLIESEELDAVNEHLNEIYSWCLSRSMPSTTIRRGIYFVKRSMVTEFEERLTEARRKLRIELVPKFIATYSDCKLAMRAEGKLGDLYRETDYPQEKNLAELFGIQWSWLALSVPDELPEEVRQRETVKLRESFLQAQQEIKYALRTGFKELIDHATERLTVKPGERPKMFRDTLVTNLKEFFDTFHARNLMDDAELTRLVESARRVVENLPANIDVLRGSDGVRASAAASFAKLNAAVGELVVDAPQSRKFNFDL